MMLNRIFKAPEQSFFLLGPRGTGKSTWLRAIYPDGPVMKTKDGIDALPFRRFAEELASGTLWN